MYDYEIFGKNLEKQMKKHGYNQADLATYLGVSRSVISRYIKGESVARMNKVQRLADLFHIQVSDLLEEEPTARAYDLALTLKERDLVQVYRNMTDMQKKMLETYVEFILEKEFKE